MYEYYYSVDTLDLKPRLQILQTLLTKDKIFQAK